MADICIIYASEDKALVGHLVDLLRKRWLVWWDEQIHQGDWEKAVRAAISKAKAVVPVISPYWIRTSFAFWTQLKIGFRPQCADSGR